MMFPKMPRKAHCWSLYVTLLLIATVVKTNALGNTYCVSPDGQSPDGQYPSGQNSCYMTIHDALSVAADVDTVKVYSGNYKEPVILTHSTSLIAADGAKVVIDATGQPNGIFIDGRSNAPQSGVRGVVIRGMKVRNAQFEGILIANATDVTLIYNEVSHNNLALDGNGACPGMPDFETNEGSDCGQGIHLIGVDHSSVTHNKVFDNTGGILITDETGPSNFDFIAENEVHDNPYGSGITLASYLPASSVAPSATESFGVYDTIIAENRSWSNGAKASSQGAGIGLFALSAGTRVFANVVMNNDLRNNGKGGVVIEMNSSYSNSENVGDNRIIGNSLSGNGEDPSNPGSNNPTGISVNSAGPINGTMILANRFQDETSDVVFGSLQPYTFLHLNNFAPPWGTETLLGVVSDSANWWNCASGPVLGVNPGTSGRCAADVNRLPDFTVYPWLNQPFDYPYDYDQMHDQDRKHQ